jgi:hypothetical protein
VASFGLILVVIMVFVPFGIDTLVLSTVIPVTFFSFFGSITSKSNSISSVSV